MSNPQTTQIVKALWLTAFHGNAIIAKDTRQNHASRKHLRIRLLRVKWFCHENYSKEEKNMQGRTHNCGQLRLENIGTQFDPDIASIFLDHIDEMEAVLDTGDT
jgi:ABC-type phosphate transport system auxiliary subunit